MNRNNRNKDILKQNLDIINRIKNAKLDEKRNALMKKGYVPLDQAEKLGFTKVGWDMYTKNEEIDGGPIWVLADIDNEKWLVCYTDQSDQILRNLKAHITAPMQKIAGLLKDGTVVHPGDMVEITPTVESINWNRVGQRGVIHAAMPDRSQVTFDDGGTLWMENKDLTPVRMSEQIEQGDSVRMFSHKNVEGIVTKISGNLITFKHTKTGQIFHGLKTQLQKIGIGMGGDAGPIGGSPIVIERMWLGTDPKALKYLQPHSVTPPQQTPQNQGQGMPPGGAGAGGAGGVGGAKEGIPPSIKANPTPQEMQAGTAIPAGELSMAASRKRAFNDQMISPEDEQYYLQQMPPDSDKALEFARRLMDNTVKKWNVSAKSIVQLVIDKTIKTLAYPPAEQEKIREFLQMNLNLDSTNDWPTDADIKASKINLTKTARVIYPGDQIQKKSTGQQGQILDIGFHHKLGKYYHVNYGDNQPVIEYETDIMKLSQSHGGRQSNERTNIDYSKAPMGQPTEVYNHRVPQQASRKKIALDMYSPEDFEDDAGENIPSEYTQALEQATKMFESARREAELSGDYTDDQMSQQEEDMHLANRVADRVISRLINMPFDQKEKLFTFLVNHLVHTNQEPGFAEFREQTKEMPIYTADEAKALENSSSDEMWDLAAGRRQGTDEDVARAKDYITRGIVSHKKPFIRTGISFISKTAEHKYYQDCTKALTSYGFNDTEADWISKTLTATGTIDQPLLRKNLARTLNYSPKAINDLITTAQALIGNMQVFAIGTPGMETLRGGGGGYPGAQDIEPMGWTVKNPQKDQNTPTPQLEQALQENLMDQSQPMIPEPKEIDVKLDMQNKQIVIDFNQEQEPPITLNQGQPGQDQQGPPNMAPTPGDLNKAPQPGSSTAPGGNAMQNFQNQEIPVSF